VLQVRGLTAGYHDAPVIRDITLDASAGEVVALFGANGAGKTTTLNAICALLRPMSGEVLVDGATISNSAAHRVARRGVAHVPEGRGVFHGLTVAEHLRLGNRRDPLSADLVFEYFPELAPLSDRRAGHLSGGEQQMLALGCAMARRPRLLLIDELSLGLAPIIVRRILPVIRDFADAHQSAVILVEQHVELALSIADRGYVMVHGEIVHGRDAAELRDDPSLLIDSYMGAT